MGIEQASEQLSEADRRALAKLRSRREGISFEDETKSCLIKLYVSPRLGTVIGRLAAIDTPSGEVGPWLRLLAEDEVRARQSELGL